MANPRYKALEIIQNRKPIEPTEHPNRLSEIFACNVFTMDVMQQYLPGEVYKKVVATIQQGTVVDGDIADSVARGMQNWAIERGATHYTHWFQPLTGLTAEKHDAFFTLKDGKPLELFSGANLTQQEPDASSLPSGGIRNTFEARGYTAWDPSSPAFIFENPFGKTLCIPTIFVSYTGEALDYKAPLLKSLEAVENAALPIVNIFDRNAKKIEVTLGCEQEYFLIDRAYLKLRPDLQLAGRAVLGAPPARGQQLDDHYFGSIPERVYGFMKECEIEALKLGIPMTTRHNEVAPHQFECAPIFEELNVAVDHNNLYMDLMDRVALKHNFAALLHEKPFAGVNGSGKHNNWSMSTDTGKNLLNPGSSPRDNLMFLTFFINTVRAVHQHADLLRAVIASAANDHRLGANEAPPAIISVFIGSQLSRILDELEKPSDKRESDDPQAYVKLGIPKIPAIQKDNTDRNRTSPFAFTGQKFEFRAVGSSANTSGAMIVLNSIVAQQLQEFRKTLNRKLGHGKKKEEAILEILSQYVKESKDIRFEGNGYSQEWEEEAARRGLNNIKKTPQALDAYISESTISLFGELGIFSKHELHARHEIRLEQYIKKISIEAKLMEEMVIGKVLPAAFDYQKKLVDAIESMQDIDLDKELYAPQLEMVKEVSKSTVGLHKSVKELGKKLAKTEGTEEIRDAAIHLAEVVIPIMDEVRKHSDSLETLVEDGIWPLPKFSEMLFNR